MTIGFKQIPANIRVPLFYAEVDPSRANTGSINQRALVIGQITADGTATPNVPVICAGVEDAKDKGGVGSMLALMVDAYRKNDAFGELWMLPVEDDGAATAATGTIEVTAAPTAAGTVSLYIAGVRVTVGVAYDDTVNEVAAAINAAINAKTDLPVTATVATDTVTLEAKNAGAAGNDIDIRVNYLGTAGGEALPASLALTITGMSGGATNPTLTTALANLSDEPFDYIVCPYSDSTSLNAVSDLLNDTTGRWSWSQQIYGHCFSAKAGDLSALTTFGGARNNQHETVIGFDGSPTPPWAWASAIAAQAAVSSRADPGLPMQTLPLIGVLAPPIQSRFALTDRNTLLYTGVSTFAVAQDGTVSIENLITTYQENAFSQPDDSYLQVETMFLLAYCLRRLARVVTSKYVRVKLAANGTRFAPGSSIVTPNIIKGDIIAEYRAMEYEGYVQKADLFKESIIVEQNASNPNRVDVLWPGVLINQLRIFALLAQFRHQ